MRPGTISSLPVKWFRAVCVLNESSSAASTLQPTDWRLFSLSSAGAPEGGVEGHRTKAKASYCRVWRVTKRAIRDPKANPEFLLHPIRGRKMKKPQKKFEFFLMGSVSAARQSAL